MLYAIGDVHGMRGELEKLIRALSPVSEDHLVFIGDYVDRGPDPCGVVDFALELKESYRCTFLSPRRM